MDKGLTKKMVADVVAKYAARETLVNSVAFSYRFLSKNARTNALVRSLNIFSKIFNVRFSFSRYESRVYAYSCRHDDSLYREYKSNDVMINFGSGAFFHPRWTNYDLPGKSLYYKKLLGTPNKDFIPIDLSKDIPLPIERNSVSLIYCSHTIEHLPEIDAIKFLTECSRILKKKGCLRLVFPDVTSDYCFAEILSRQNNIDSSVKIESVLAAAYNSFSPSSEYQLSDLEDIFTRFGYDGDKIYEQLRLNDSLDGAFRPENPGYHLSFWSHKKMLDISNDCGFSMYLPKRKGSSEYAPFTNTCVFDNTEPQYSLYGELIK